MFRLLFLSQLFTGLLFILLVSACGSQRQSTTPQDLDSATIATTPNYLEVPNMLENVIAEVILRKKDGTSILSAEGGISAETVAMYRVEEEVIQATVRELEALGFEVKQTNPFGMTISGDKALFETVFRTTLSVEQQQEQAYYQTSQPIQVPEHLSDEIAAITLPIPPEYIQ